MSYANGGWGARRGRPVAVWLFLTVPPVDEFDWYAQFKFFGAANRLSGFELFGVFEYVKFLPLRATLTALLRLAQLGLQRLLQRMHCRAPLSAEDRVENRGKILGVALPCVLLGCFCGPLTQARTDLVVVVKPADHGS